MMVVVSSYFVVLILKKALSAYLYTFFGFGAEMLMVSE